MSDYNKDESYIKHIFKDLDSFNSSWTTIGLKNCVTTLKNQFRSTLQRIRMLESDLDEAIHKKYVKLANNGQIFQYWGLEYFSQSPYLNETLSPQEKESLEIWVKKEDYVKLDRLFEILPELYISRYELWKKHNRMVFYYERARDLETHTNTLEEEIKKLKSEEKSPKQHKTSKKTDEIAKLKKENSELQQKIYAMTIANKKEAEHLYKKNQELSQLEKNKMLEGANFNRVKKDLELKNAQLEAELRVQERILKKSEEEKRNLETRLNLVAEQKRSVEHNILELRNFFDDAAKGIKEEKQKILNTAAGMALFLSKSPTIKCEEVLLPEKFLMSSDMPQYEAHKKELIRLADEPFKGINAALSPLLAQDAYKDRTQELLASVTREQVHIKHHSIPRFQPIAYLESKEIESLL